jgi:predicted DNA-binding antitoxin AbrB/MazE fold protein
MGQHFQARFENGLLRPLKPLPLKEHQVVSISLHENDTTGTPPEQQPSPALAQKRARFELTERMEALPAAILSTVDLSNLDHDFILYGWKK